MVPNPAVIQVGQTLPIDGYANLNGYPRTIYVENYGGGAFFSNTPSWFWHPDTPPPLYPPGSAGYYSQPSPGLFKVTTSVTGRAVGSGTLFYHLDWPGGTDCQVFSRVTVIPAPLPAVINARTKQITPSDISCAAINASTTYVTPTTLNLSPVVAPGAQIQAGSSYVTWSTPTYGTYTLQSTPPAGYVLQNACWTRSPTAPTSGQSMAAAVAAGDTLTWNVGYSLGTPWVQTQGGDVFAATTLKSLMTPLASPRLFNTNGLGGYPGAVLYGATGVAPYNFNADATDPTFGANYVSSTNWLANEPGDGGSKDPFKTDWYTYFLYQFDLSNATPDYTNPATPIAKPASRATPYYVQGDMTTSGNWTVGIGENIIFVVTGNVLIKGKINITGTGFVSFIAKGNITIDPTVGVPYTSSTPVVEGMYVTSPTGSFITGTSGAGTERFVGKGSFIAGGFLLQRDLSSVGQNGATSAELFTYNPQLLFTMPDKMKDVKVKWTEVAP